MANYTLEEKDSFIVIGLGTEFKSHHTDFAGINKEKADFWKAASEDGTLDALKAIAENDSIFAVSEAVNGKMMHHAGVLAEVSAAPEGAKVIPFPKGDYIVVKGEANTFDELNNQLPAIAFGQALAEINDYAYVGGPNTLVLMGHRNGLAFGEMWIPVVKK